MQAREIFDKALSGKWTVMPYCGVFLVITYLIGTFGGARLREMVFGHGLIPHLILFTSSFALGFLTYKYIQLRITMANMKAIATVINKKKQIYDFLKAGETRADHTSSALNLLQEVPDGREKDRLVMLLGDAKQSGQDTALKRLEMTLDLDAQASDDSFRIPQVLSWTVPMLGFLGTVHGISSSLSDFKLLMGDVDRIGEIKEALGGITSGLGLAFDTTLLGLFFAIAITGLAAYLQHRESSCFETFERHALVLLKIISKHESGQVQSKDEKDTAALLGLTEALKDVSQQLHKAERMFVQPSQNLQEALTGLAHYVNTLSAIAHESNTMASERSTLEAAAKAILDLRTFSHSMDLHTDASKRLHEAAIMLQQPKEFRLIEKHVRSHAPSHQQGNGAPFECENCGLKRQIPDSTFHPGANSVRVRCPQCDHKQIVSRSSQAPAN